ncbi:MAG: YibE/F family protein [Oscillospiraceae bacterium]|nr:YibE/F family protein [Oscillospiraceae bacterium]
MGKVTKRDWILYMIVLLFSAVFLIGGWKMTTAGSKLLGQNVNGSIAPAVKAEIVEVLSKNEIFSQYTGTVTELRTVCYAVISEGEDEGKRVLVTHVMDSTAMLTAEPFEEGDRVFIYEGENEYGEAQWFVEGPVRSGWLLGLTAAFCVLVVLFGLGKGIRTILSLILTCLAIFCVLVPAIIGGFNIYLTAIIVCLYTVIVTLSLVSGCTFKSLAAALGCAGGVGIAGLITIVSEKYLRLTGLTDDDSMLLLFINEDKPIDLKALIFAGILIGALGATMDVAMSISSSLTELIANVPDMGFFRIIRSGFSIGRDIMGTMANTLVLAYVGSGLHVTLLFMTYYERLEDILNVELIAVEILQAMAGSIGILFTIPASTLAVAGFRLLERRKK